MLSAFVPGDVDVVIARGAPVVTLRGARLITVTAMDARLAGRAPREVADAWVR